MFNTMKLNAAAVIINARTNIIASIPVIFFGFINMLNTFFPDDISFNTKRRFFAINLMCVYNSNTMHEKLVN